MIGLQPILCDCWHISLCLDLSIHMHTDRHLDFMSHNPLAHKFAVAKTLQRRTRAICSDVMAKDKHTRHIRKALINNGYPTPLSHGLAYPHLLRI